MKYELDIALDVEGVLADTYTAAAERSDVLEPEHPSTFSFDTQEEKDEYMHVSQNLWHNHNHLIPPMEDTLWWRTTQLDKHHNIDIVTARTGVDAQVREWLDGYRITYDNLIITSDPFSDKTEYGDHDLHIDDSPNVARDALEAGRFVFLIDAPYNQDVEEHERLRRVSGVTEATELLCDAAYLHHIDPLIK